MSLGLAWPVVRHVLSARPGARVCAVCPDAAALHRLRALAASGEAARLDVVDHAGAQAIGRVKPPAVRHRLAWGPEGLDVPPCDVLLLGGEPNAPFVQAILDAAARMVPAPLVVVAGTGWPHGHRDGYPPASVVPAELRPPTALGGLTPGAERPGPGGVLPDWRHAIAEGGPRNGVLAPVRALVGEGWSLHAWPGHGGVAVLAPADVPAAEQAVLDGLGTSRQRERWTADLERARAALAAEVADLRRPFADEPDEARHDPAVHELERLAAISVGMRRDVRAAAKRVDDLGDRLAEVERERDAAASERDAAASERDAAASERDALAERVRELDVALGVAEGARDAAASERDALAERVRELDAARGAAEGERDVLADRLAALTADQADLQERADAVTAQHEALTAEHHALRAERDELEGALADVRGRLEASELGRAALRRLAAEFQEDIAALAERLAAAERGTKEQLAANEQLAAEERRLRALLRASEDELLQARTDVQAHADVQLKVLDLLERAEASTTWRTGTGIARLWRAMTFRRMPKGPSAIRAAHALLEPGPAPAPTAPGAAPVVVRRAPEVGTPPGHRTPADPPTPPANGNGNGNGGAGRASGAPAAERPGDAS